SKRREDIGPDLDAGKADIGDVGDRLQIVPAPGDGRVAELDVGWRRRDRRVEIRQVPRRVQPRGASRPPRAPRARPPPPGPAAAVALGLMMNARRDVIWPPDPRRPPRSSDPNTGRASWLGRARKERRVMLA